MASGQHNVTHISAAENSETDLQALFDSVLSPGANIPQQVPWSMRKLPNSFFNPPTTGSKSIDHSRENSSDSGTYTSSGIFTMSPLNSIPLQTVHHRAHSSPASFQETDEFGTYSCCLHTKQHSYDQPQSNVNVPLPSGWEEARTPQGQVYYLNHITKTTTWEDPRKNSNNSSSTQSNNKPSIMITKYNSDFFGPFPEGWEQSMTPDGEIYFINHITRTTTWYDPRIPMHLQTVSEAPVTSWGNSQCIKQQDRRLQLLHQEREKLKERREELKKQLLMNDKPRPATNIYHSHQESSDSALGESLKDWIPFETPLNSDVMVTTQENFSSPEIRLNVEPTSSNIPLLSGLSDTMDYADGLACLELEKEFSM